MGTFTEVACESFAGWEGLTGNTGVIVANNPTFTNIPSMFATSFTDSNPVTRYMKGTYRKRPVGPRKAADPAPGSSLLVAMNDGAFFRQNPNYPNCNNFMVGAWYFLDERSRYDDSNHVGGGSAGGGAYQLVDYTNGYSRTSISILLNPWSELCAYVTLGHEGTLTPTITYWGKTGGDANIRHTTDGTTILTDIYSKWICIVYAQVGDTAAWYYRYPTDTSFTLWQSISRNAEHNFSDPFAGKFPVRWVIGNNWESGTSARWQGRLGLPIVATITDLADVSNYCDQSRYVNPPARTTYYCKRTGTGTASGLSLANAWSPSQMIDEINNGTIIANRYPLQVNGTTLPLSTDVATLKGLWEAEALTHVGDEVLIDDEGQEIRVTTTDSNQSCLRINFSCGGMRFGAAPGKTANFNGSTVISSWDTTAYPNVFSAAFTGTHTYLWEDGAWLAHLPYATNVAGQLSAMAASGMKCFGWDGTKIYLGLPTGNPNSNGHVYERANLGSGFGCSAPSLWIHDISVVKTGCMDNTTSYVPSAAIVGYGATYPFSIGSIAGLSIYENIYTAYGDKHNFGIVASATYPNSSRTLVADCTTENCMPSFVFNNALGAQTASVWMHSVAYSSALSTNNQLYWYNVNSYNNGGSYNSSPACLDPLQLGWLTHTDDPGTPSGNVSVLILDSCNFGVSGVNEIMSNYCANVFIRNMDFGATDSNFLTRMDPGDFIDPAISVDGNYNFTLNWSVPGASKYNLVLNSGTLLQTDVSSGIEIAGSTSLPTTATIVAVDSNNIPIGSGRVNLYDAFATNDMSGVRNGKEVVLTWRNTSIATLNVSDNGGVAETHAVSGTSHTLTGVDAGAFFITALGISGNTLLQGSVSIPAITNIISTGDYLKISSLYGEIKDTLMACTQNIYDATDVVAEIDEIEPTVDLIVNFYNSYRSNETVLSSFTGLLAAVRTLNSHILNRGGYSSIGATGDSNSYLGINGLKVSAGWAYLSNLAGQTIDISYVGVSTGKVFYDGINSSTSTLGLSKCQRTSTGGITIGTSTEEEIKSFALATWEDEVKFICIDTTTFDSSFRNYHSAPQTATANAQPIVQAIQWIKEVAPMMKVSFSGFPYSFETSNLVDFSTGATQWSVIQGINDFLAPIFESYLDYSSPTWYSKYVYGALLFQWPNTSTAVLPSVTHNADTMLYTDRIGLISTINECKRLFPQKPVLPILAPEYKAGGNCIDNAGPRFNCVGVTIPTDIFAQLVYTAKLYGDGAIFTSIKDTTTQWQTETLAVINE